MMLYLVSVVFVFSLSFCYLDLQKAFDTINFT